ncbi:MAG TPA: VOC family protein [Clostridia bacterium]|nr:VOC family protein [Clostridia bacterium]
MKICWTTIHVGNLEKSLAFYRDLLGLSICRKMDHGKTQIVFFGEEGQTQFEVICAEGESVENPGKGISVGFEVENLDAWIERFRNAGHAVTDPVSPGKVRFCFVTDPDGYRIQLVEQG